MNKNKNYHPYLFRTNSFLLMILYLCYVLSPIGLYDFYNSDYQCCAVLVCDVYVWVL